ncbi:30S ribosomal protein S20 [Carex littledalei]|uniref:30S ribosomal protein S20 n=1 Tax=Carex littledalei TaxID=544730 RepID=A0A833RH41_9POAL|nr:30S ribosomal protein S20 [Carex littledalei]
MASLSFAPCGLTSLSLSSNANRYFSFASSSCRTRSLSASLFSLQTGAGAFSSTLRLSNKSYQRRGALVVCEAGTGTVKKPDQAAKRMRQNAKKRLRNKSRKSEIRTRTRKVVWELGALRKKKDATPDDVLPIEKMISVIYSKIDKAVRKGVLHKNTASHRKSRLARRKRALLIYRGWYNPAAAAENPTPTSVSA